MSTNILCPDHPLRLSMKRHSRTLGRIASIGLLIYWIALATGTHVPSYMVGPAAYNDKVAHFLGYAGLAFLMGFAWATHRGFHRRHAVMIWCAAIVYGAIDELLQIPVPGRTGEIGDWIADGLGSLLGIACFMLLWAVARNVVGRLTRVAEQ